MKLYLIPYESITLYTSKSKEDFFTSLTKQLNHRIGSTTKFIIPDGSDYFEIQRKISNRSGTLIIAKGSIFIEDKKKTIIMDVTAKDTYAVVFAIIWYSVNTLIFLLLFYVSIRDQQFTFSILLPLFFIFLGYGFTTATMQGSIDHLIEEIQTVIK